MLNAARGQEPLSLRRYALGIVTRFEDAYGGGSWQRAAVEQLEALLKRDIREGVLAPWNPAELRAMDYSRYTLHPHWRLTRERILERSAGRCEKCGARAQHVHHKTYERLGEERDDDLLAVCEPCHAEEHGGHLPGPLLSAIRQVLGVGAADPQPA